MKRALVIVVVVVALAAVGLGFMAFSSGPVWTATSPEAVAEFEAAMEAKARLYTAEADAHLKRALELDPDFVMAKLELAFGDRYEASDSEARERLLEEVREADLSELTDREQFLIGYTLARVDKEPERAEALLEGYLKKNPKDFYAVYVKAALAWGERDLETAERLLKRVIELNPNWVLAHNLLGYIGMEVGRFAESEEHFRTYRFIAPDQANPHDSLGELLTLRGRYEEAVEEFDAALETRGDFWASYIHMMMVHLYQHDWEAARAVVARAQEQENHPEWLDELSTCVVDVNEAMEDRSWHLALDIVDEHCTSDSSRRDLRATLHRLCCFLGHEERALEVEADLAADLDKLPEAQHSEASFASGLLENMKAVRLATAGNHEAAIESFHAADELLRYRGDGEGMFRLWNRLCLVETLNAVGRPAEAEDVLRSVRAVNPVMAGSFVERGMCALTCG